MCQALWKMWWYHLDLKQSPRPHEAYTLAGERKSILIDMCFEKKPEIQNNKGLVAKVDRESFSGKYAT